MKQSIKEWWNTRETVTYINDENDEMSYTCSNGEFLIGLTVPLLCLILFAILMYILQ